MIKSHRTLMWRASIALWGLSAVATGLALLGGDHMKTWYALQLPLLILAGCATVVSILGRVIAPTRESYRLGYEAGLRDGARAMMSGAEVLDLRGRRATDWQPSLHN